MSRQGDRRRSRSCFAHGKQQRSAVPCVREQQAAGCQNASCGLQRVKGRDGFGPSFAPHTRMEPARPWHGAGQGGKRKASPADAGGLAVKHSLAERQERSMECGTAPKRGRGADPKGKIYVKAPLQAGGLPGAAGPSAGGRHFPAVHDHSFSKTMGGRKREGVEEERQKAELWPAKKQQKVECHGAKAQSPHQSRGGVPAPTAHPGPAPALTKQIRSSKRRARRRRQQKERRAEMKKAALRAAAACAESSAMTRLVEMMEKLQLKD